MKSKILHPVTSVAIGAVLLFAVNSANADEPKHKHRAQTEKLQADNNPIPAKADRTGQIATRDGKHSTSVDGGPVGGAQGRETRVPTGSHIPQTYERRASTTNTPGNTFIFDKNDQRLQQSINVQDSLRSVPGVNVGGSR